MGCCYRRRGDVIRFGHPYCGAIHIPVIIADDPLTTVVRGTGKVLENPEFLKEFVSPEGYDEAIINHFVFSFLGICALYCCF
jgi:hypothetical protein